MILFFLLPHGRHPGLYPSYTAMVFTMNTSVFAEEVALDSTDEVAAVTVDEAEAEA